MKTYLEPDDLDIRIELLPLIDVIFCILVFFILGAVSFNRLKAVNIDLPQSDTAQAQFDQTFPVEIDLVGQIKVENVPISQEQLSQLAANYLRQNPKGIIEIQADEKINYGQVIALFDTLRQIGGTQVALSTIPKNPSSKPNGASSGIVPNAPLSPQIGSPQIGAPQIGSPQLGAPQPGLSPVNPSVPGLPIAPGGTTTLPPSVPTGAPVP